MGYETGEALIETIVRAATSFSASNVVRANWKALNTGKAAYYAILRPGYFDTAWISPDTYVAHWTTVVELWERYIDDSTTQTALYGHAANLMAAVMPRPRLGDTTGVLQDSTVEGAAAPQEMWNRGGKGPSWLKWELSVRWKEQVTVTIS